MAKRFLALFMALALSLSFLSFSAFAAGWTQPSLEYDESAKELTVKWDLYPDATGYNVALYREGAEYRSSGTLAKNVQSYSFNNMNIGGTYEARVIAVITDSVPESAVSNPVTVKTTVTTGSITVTDMSDKTAVSWIAVAGATGYVLNYSYYDASTALTKTGSAQIPADTTSYEIDVKFSYLNTVTLYYYDSSSQQRVVGTVTIPHTGTSTGSAAIGTGVTLSNGFLNWSGSSEVRIAVSVNGALRGYLDQSGNIVTNLTDANTVIQGSSVNILNVIQNLGFSSSYVTFMVYDSKTNTLIGAYNFTTAVLIQSTPNWETGTINISWPQYPNATSYYVEAVPVGNPGVMSNRIITKTTDETSCDLGGVLGSTYSLTIYALINDQTIGRIGPVGISAAGTVNPGSYVGSYTPFGIYPTKSGFANVLWFSMQNANGYLVEVTANGENQTFTAYGNALSVPYTFGTETEITVSATVNGQVISKVGTALISETGAYTTTGGNSWIVQGENCILSVGQISSTLTFNATNYSGMYCITYTVDGAQRMTIATSNSATLPVGIGSSFSVTVMTYENGVQGETVATVSYTPPESTGPANPATCAHAYEYKTDVHYHWQVCPKCNSCITPAEHTFKAGICTACGYQEKLKFDVNGDGRVTLDDAIAALKKAMGVE